MSVVVTVLIAYLSHPQVALNAYFNCVVLRVYHYTLLHVSNSQQGSQEPSQLKVTNLPSFKANNYFFVRIVVILIVGWLITVSKK